MDQEAQACLPPHPERCASFVRITRIQHPLERVGQADLKGSPTRSHHLDASVEPLSARWKRAGQGAKGNSDLPLRSPRPLTHLSGHHWSGSTAHWQTHCNLGTREAQGWHHTGGCRRAGLLGTAAGPHIMGTSWTSSSPH